MVPRELCETAERGPAGLRIVRERRHRHQTADQGIALEVSLDLALFHPTLRRFAGEVDLKEPRDGQPTGSGVGVDGVDELADLIHDPCLVRLERTDELPPELVTTELVLTLHVLHPVLADGHDAGFGEHAHILLGDVFRSRDHGDVAPHLAADVLIGRADRVDVHGSSCAARPSSHARSLRVGSSTTSPRSV